MLAQGKAAAVLARGGRHVLMSSVLPLVMIGRAAAFCPPGGWRLHLASGSMLAFAQEPCAARTTSPHSLAPGASVVARWASDAVLPRRFLPVFLGLKGGRPSSSRVSSHAKNKDCGISRAEVSPCCCEAMPAGSHYPLPVVFVYGCS